MNTSIASFFQQAAIEGEDEGFSSAKFIESWESMLTEWADLRDVRQVILSCKQASGHSIFLSHIPEGQTMVFQQEGAKFAEICDMVVEQNSHIRILEPVEGDIGGCGGGDGFPLHLDNGAVFGCLFVCNDRALSAVDIHSLELIRKLIEKDLGAIDALLHSLNSEQSEVESLSQELAEWKNKYRTEISTLEKVKDKLERSEANFFSLVQNIPGIVYHCALDADWTMHLISDDVELVTGYPASDFIQNKVRPWADSIYHEDRQFVEDCVMEGVENEKTFKMEYRIQHKDGSIRWAYEQGQAVRGIEGELLWLDGVILDITDKKEAEFELKKSEERGKMLKEVAVSANAAPKVSEVLQSAIDSICHYSGWPVGHVYLVNQEHSELVSSNMWHLKDVESFCSLQKVASRYKYPKGVGVPGVIWQTKQPYWCEDVKKDPVFRRTFLGEDSKIHSTFGFPIQADGEVIAVLEFFSDQQLDRDEDLLNVIQKIGEQLEIVLQRKYSELRLLDYQDSLEVKVQQRTMELKNSNHHLAESLDSLNKQRLIMDADLEMAKQLQTSFLPESFPFSEEIRFGGYYSACDTIGGDLYDAFPLSDELVGIYMADVTGHGVSAAMVTAVLKVSIDRALKHLQWTAHNEGDRLSDYVDHQQFMNELNAEMFKVTAEDKFVTFQLILLNVKDGQMLIANAGHTRPIFLSGGTARSVALPSNMAIGLMKQGQFEAYDLSVSRGDKIVVYTDGLTERANTSGEEFGEERLLETVEKFATQSPEELCGSVVVVNEVFSEGVNVTDDIALLTIEYVG